MRILKFGGKSLDSIEKMQNICKNIKKIYKNDKKIIIIVSAIGKTTDNLLEISKKYSSKTIAKRELDVLLSTGETQSSALFSIMLNSLNIPAKSFQAWQLNISTFGDYQNSRIAYINKQPLVDCINENYVAVVSGFQGINKNNELTTLGRGGSDTTASAIGAVFDQDVEIYSDFDGICSGDPRLLNFKKIKNISYDSIKRASHCGAKVLDFRATQIAKDFNFKIICKQSSNLGKAGSVVSDIEKSFICMSTIDNLCKITIEFSNDKNIKLISQIVLNQLNNCNFYNFEINFNNISFYVLENDKLNILKKVAKKLKLLKNKN